MTYRQPPLNRGVHPQKMNWLWRLICEAGYITVSDVMAALRERGIEVGQARAEGWLKSESDDGYFPLTIAELEQNLRLILAARANSAPAGDTQASD